LNNAEITPPSISNHSCDGTEKVLLKFKELEHVKPKSRANFLGMLSWETPPARCPSMAAHILTD
jgi:hypothetical protein